MHGDDCGVLSQRECCGTQSSLLDGSCNVVMATGGEFCDEECPTDKQQYNSNLVLRLRDKDEKQRKYSTSCETQESKTGAVRR